MCVQEIAIPTNLQGPQVILTFRNAPLANKWRFRKQGEGDVCGIDRHAWYISPILMEPLMREGGKVRI
jgi:hypothetical protein